MTQRPVFISVFVTSYRRYQTAGDAQNTRGEAGYPSSSTRLVDNNVCVDLNLGEGGRIGQVFVFGRDFDTKVVPWSGDGPEGWAR